MKMIMRNRPARGIINPSLRNILTGLTIGVMCIGLAGSVTSSDLESRMNDGQRLSNTRIARHFDRDQYNLMQQQLAPYFASVGGSDDTQTHRNVIVTYNNETGQIEGYGTEPVDMPEFKFGGLQRHARINYRFMASNGFTATLYYDGQESDGMTAAATEFAREGKGPKDLQAMLEGYPHCTGLHIDLKMSPVGAVEYDILPVLPYDGK